MVHEVAAAAPEPVMRGRAQHVDHRPWHRVWRLVALALKHKVGAVKAAGRHIYRELHHLRLHLALPTGLVVHQQLALMLHVLDHAEVNLLQRELDGEGLLLALVGLGLGGQTLKCGLDVIERLVGVIGAEELAERLCRCGLGIVGEKAALSATLVVRDPKLEGVLAKEVIEALQLGVRQHLVSLADARELLHRAGIVVRVELERQLPVCFLHGEIVRVAREAQHLIVV
mmetsp:Transcript_36239/g.94120  ORF Transcript_36239/g.94120 Transcript_36239/m.94120 type:complete len:228 (-) Transcript_36239:206-889(-)